MKKIDQKINILVLMALLALQFVGCTKDATNITVPETKSKLVVGCFISPQDTVLSATITRSNPIFGSEHNKYRSLEVADALVVISDGISSITLPYSASNLRYQISSKGFTIKPGATYYLTVSEPTGENVSASCTIPSSNLSSLTIEFTDTTTSTKKVNVKWQDIIGESNYYKVVGQIVFEDSLNNLADSLIYNYLYDGNTGNTIHLNSDSGKDGKDFLAKLEGYSDYYVYDNVGYHLAPIIGYDFYVLNISEEYFKYQNSVNNYTYDDPFSEPTPIYTNIKNGLGIFAGYQLYYIRKI